MAKTSNDPFAALREATLAPWLRVVGQFEMGTKSGTDGVAPQYE